MADGGGSERPGRLRNWAQVSESEIGRDMHLNFGAGRLEELPVHDPPRWLPPRQERFAGRTTELGELEERLGRAQEGGVVRQVAVQAPGGVGKTALAVEYGWRHLEDYAGGVFFLPCERATGGPPLAVLAPSLGLVPADDAESAAARVRAELETGEPSLLILDDVSRGQWMEDGWREQLPGGACRWLVTTRADRLPGTERYPLSHLSIEDGVALLSNYRTDVEAHRERAEEVVDWLNGWAVGLTVVGAYMELHPNLSWERYVDSLQAKGLGAVRAAERDVGEVPRYRQRTEAVIDDLLEAMGASERRAVEYTALLPEDQVYRLWLETLLTADGEIEVEKRPGYEDRPATPILERLVGRQVLQVQGEGERVLDLHRVVREHVREGMAEDEEGREALIDRIVELAEARGKACHDALTEPELRQELTPLVALAGELDRLGRTGAGASLANWVHSPLRALGRYAEARASLERFVSVLEDLPPKAAATLQSHYALTLKDLGELGEARERMERAIEIGEAHYPEDHPTLAIRYSNLAIILQRLGELGEARARMERAIEIGEARLPEDHPTLATGYSNLAIILHDFGELGQARDRMERAIEIDEAGLPEDHPGLAISYSNLATILKDLGELGEAREWMERAIEIDEAQLPEDHPGLAIGYSNLALILQDLGELGEARARMERAIEIDKACLPDHHPSLAIRYNNLAYLELDAGNRDRACELLRRAETILGEHFDNDHPHRQNVRAALQAKCGDDNEDQNQKQSLRG